MAGLQDLLLRIVPGLLLRLPAERIEKPRSFDRGFPK
jgi:hypothetical protein